MSKRIISVELFSKIMNILFNENTIDGDTVVHLYNWGEPLLHPDLENIMHALNAFGLTFVLSTNASVTRKFSKEAIRNLRHVIISMPGFSQRSYDRINKLSFENVKGNIINLVKNLREHNYQGTISISYHVYQFNVCEMLQCEMFARTHGISFNPYYALINEWNMLKGWVNGTLSHEHMSRISEDIFCFDIREIMKSAPKDYRCPQHDFLVIDTEGNIIACCQLPIDRPDYICGNILTERIDDILTNKRNRPFCADCIDSGMAYYINNAMIRPQFYHDICFSDIVLRTMSFLNLRVTKVNNGLRQVFLKPFQKAQ